MTHQVKYPGCDVQLVGTTNNSVIIFMKVARVLHKHLVNDLGWSLDDATREVEKFKEEARSGDSENVLVTCYKWVEVS